MQAIRERRRAHQAPQPQAKVTQLKQTAKLREIVSRDWLYAGLSPEGRAKLLREHGLLVA